MLLVSRSDGAYHHGHLASALEEAALELLDRSSHTAVSLREVARIAGVSHSAPYHHFGDRQALLKRLAELCMADLIDAVRGARDAAPTPDARLLAFGMAYVAYANRYPYRFGVIYDPEVCVPGAATGEMAGLIQEIEDMLDGVVADARPGLDAQQAAVLAASAWATAHGLATLTRAGHIPAAAIEPALAAAVSA